MQGVGWMDRIVYTFGCWDILHPGHIRILKKAKSLGDKLIVGVVFSQAIREKKGAGRPIMCLSDRMEMIRSLNMVDSVVVQETFDPSYNLELYGVNIFVRGDDWDCPEGKNKMESMGGQTILLPYSKEYSTTKIIERIQCLSSATIFRQ